MVDNAIVSKFNTYNQFDTQQDPKQDPWSAQNCLLQKWSLAPQKC